MLALNLNSDSQILKVDMLVDHADLRALDKNTRIQLGSEGVRAATDPSLESLAVKRHHRQRVRTCAAVASPSSPLSSP